MRLSLKTILVSLFGLSTLVAGAQGISTIRETSAMRSTIDAIATNWLPSVDQANRMNTITSDYRIRQYRLATIRDDQAALAEAAQRFETQVSLLATTMRAYEPLISSAEEQQAYDAFKSGWREYEEIGRRSRDAALRGDQAAALALLVAPETRRIYDLTGDFLDKVVDINRQGADRDGKIAAQSAAAAILVAWIAMLLGVAVGIVATFVSFFRIAQPITHITQSMRGLADGDTVRAIPYGGRGDEIGAMAAAVQVFKDNMIRTRALEAETALARADAETQRKTVLRDMADRFEGAVGGIVGTVSQLQTTAGTMSSAAGQTAAQSATVAAAAAQAGSNVATVAAAAEELGASVEEIGRQVDGAARLAGNAVAAADQTGVLVRELSEAATRIGEVVGMISAIAGQTNLLALNATIEAARAGEAGRGFAVVATEVKELASQTNRATDEISRQIGAIQTSTLQAVDAIGSIASRIREINGVAASIAVAVEEQGAATREIVRNVGQAAVGTGEVTTNISGVAGAAEETGAAAAQVLSAASDLTGEAARLGTEVRSFLATIRAA